MEEVDVLSGSWSLTDHGNKAESKIRISPFDLESWNVLVREAQVSYNDMCHQYQVNVYVMYLAMPLCVR